MTEGSPANPIEGGVKWYVIVIRSGVMDVA